MPTPSSQATPATFRLRDGGEMRVRPVGPEDAPLLGEFFETLSPQTVYHRFLTPVHRVSRLQLERAARVDERIDCVLAACVREADRWRIVGVGRFRRNAVDHAELAIVVADAWQRRGVASLLLRCLTDVARALGLAWFDSTIDPCNLPLMRFAEAVGFKGNLQYRDGLLHMRTDIGALFPDPPVDPVDAHERP